MPPNSIYSRSNDAIALSIGQRLEKRRLDANISQQVVAAQLGVTPKTYRSIAKGEGKLIHYIAILRILGELPLADEFVPEDSISPMSMLKAEALAEEKPRQRASRKSSQTKKSSMGW